MGNNSLSQTSVFNVDNILSEIGQRGFLRPCKFLVSIAMTPAMSSKLNVLNNITQAGTVMSFWAEQAALPGAMLDVATIRRYGYGPLEPKAWGAHFTDIPIVFRLDATGMVHNFLHSWMQTVVDYNYNEDMVTGNPFTGGMPYEVGWKDDYATTAMISVFDDAAGQIVDSTGLYGVREIAGLPSLQVYLRDCFPVAIVDAPLAWSARGDYMKIGCTLSYFSWFCELGGGAIQNNPNPQQQIAPPNSNPPGS